MRRLGASLAAALLGAAAAFAADDESIRVVSVAPSTAAGALAARVECASVFSPRSLSTLQSGLSAVLRLELRLERARGSRTLLGDGDFEVVQASETARSIAYDVWDERYTVRGPDTVVVFTDLEAARRSVARFEETELTAIEDLRPGTYRLRARVQLLPVSAEQAERVAAWLRGTRTARVGSSPSGRRSEQLDVGGLLSMLWGRGPGERDRSEWATSPAFEVDAAGPSD